MHKHSTATLAGIAVAGIIFAFLAGASIGPEPAQAATFSDEYNEVIEIPGGGTVTLSCRDNVLVAVSGRFLSPTGVTGGDIAMIQDTNACRDTGQAEYAGFLSNGHGTITAHLYQKGETLIAVTPIQTDAIGTTGGSVAFGDASR